nr:zinc finger, CCHC-type [Tanacetum cinerariifolium]
MYQFSNDSFRGDANTIHTLGDYSKPSHEGYRSTIELPKENNVEDLTTSFLAQFFPLGRIAKLRNDILMFQQHQGESLSEAWTRFKDLLQKVPHHGIDLWLQVQIFYDHIDQTLKKTLDYAVEGWNDPFIPEEGSLDYENLDIKQLLGVMEYKVDALMKNVISLMRRSEENLGGKFRLGGEPREMSLLKLGWRVSLYSERKSKENATLSRKHEGGIQRNLRVKLAYRCIATTISGRKESTNRVTKIDLYYLYCIYTEGVVCNIPYWLARIFVWPATRAIMEDDEAEKEAEGESANIGSGGFV